MKRQGPWLVLVILLGSISAVSAQDVRGFVGAAGCSGVSGSKYASVGGGALVDLGTPWLSAGAQAEGLISWPYFAGRGAVFGQANVPTRTPVRPFLLAGFGMGENAGPLVGAGVEMRARGIREGIRVSVEDYLVRYNQFTSDSRFVTRTGHQIALRFSLLF